MMDDRTRTALRRLLEGQRLLSLGVVADGLPYVGLLPYALRPDFGGLLIHASRLAKHSRGLSEGAPVAILIHAPDDGTMDPLQVPRVTLAGQARAVAGSGPDEAALRQAYVARVPGGESLFALGDFTLWDLSIQGGRLVTGFAQAINLSDSDVRSLAHP